jgi:hypothetical protein
MKINGQKIEIMMSRRYKQSISKSLDNTELKQELDFKYLGTTLDYHHCTRDIPIFSRVHSKACGGSQQMFSSDSPYAFDCQRIIHIWPHQA